jgi:hypothetical protein
MYVYKYKLVLISVHYIAFMLQRSHVNLFRFYVDFLIEMFLPVPLYNVRFIHTFLGTFVKMRKASLGIVMSVCLSAPMEQLGSNWTDFN